MLGEYAVWVLSSYGAALVLIGGLVAQSVIRSARVRRELDRLEGRK
ncbi:heme exporter protein CcmD [Pontivivens ytuae]|uniref:Heme exporter protein D n=1 Tax=Pontivivens ytuae TaxID=2789856 RepID=A0A7S9LPM5_9RHOB|nr:heme exporter protein CcmD [Pontivivens ytuae]QPH52997.1 heme exporter protein CcmD [Pontivivens ytuae]